MNPEPERTPVIDLVGQLIIAGAFPGCSGRPRIVETHISVIVLTEEHAFKFKKRVKLGFLDCSTLERRRWFCIEEVRLNQRTAPEIYLGVVTISGTPDEPVLGEGGPILEYAVKMRRFPDGATLAEVVDRGERSSLDPERLADAVAKFHQSIEPVTQFSPGQLVDRVLRPALENFAELTRLRLPAATTATLSRLAHWTREWEATLTDGPGERVQQGFFRECHGDLHLGNIVLLDGRPVLFDCLEFSRELREIDVMCEVAFLVMDLACRGAQGLARRVLNRYLDRTGDYSGLGWLRFYEVYRALVRAKIAALSPAGSPERKSLRRYVDYAASVSARTERPLIVVLHGLSGSGKSTVARGLMDLVPMVAVRSDVERKRLAGLPLEEHSRSGLGQNLYRSELTDRTYRRLGQAAGRIVEAGYPAVIDAAFLRRGQRRQFAQLARELRVPYVLVQVEAPLEILERRLVRRETVGGDASEAGVAVLHEQLRNRDPLSSAERDGAIVISTERPELMAMGLRRLADRLSLR